MDKIENWTKLNSLTKADILKRSDKIGQNWKKLDKIRQKLKNQTKLDKNWTKIEESDKIGQKLRKNDERSTFC